MEDYQELYETLGHVTEQMCHDFFTNFRPSDLVSEITEKMFELRARGTPQQKEASSLAPKTRPWDNQVSLSSTPSQEVMNRFRAFKKSPFKSVFCKVTVTSKQLTQEKQKQLDSKFYITEMELIDSEGIKSFGFPSIFSAFFDVKLT